MAPTFPLLYDLIDEVRAEVQQSATDPGDDSWSDAEFARQARNVSRQLIEALMNQDVNYQVAETDLSVAADASETTLPAGCVGIVKVCSIDSNGEIRSEFNLLTWSQYMKEQGYIWRPVEGKLKWGIARHDAWTVRVVYLTEPIPSAHGLARDGSMTTIQLGLHELATTGQYIGLVIVRPEDGQSGTVTAYDGPTRTATVTGFTTAPVVGTIYSSSPPLPKAAEPVFKTLMISGLLRKYDKPRSGDLLMEARDQLKLLKQTVSIAQRHQPKRVTPGDSTPVGDPLSGGRSGLHPGNWGR